MSVSVTLVLTLGLWCAQHVSTYEFNFTHPDGSQINNLSDYCKNGCFVKCCPEKQIMLSKWYEDPKKDEKSCTSGADLIANHGVKNPDNYSDIVLYKEDSRTLSGKTANDVKFIYDGNFIDENITNTAYLNSKSISSLRAYFLENGKWSIKKVNYWYQFTTVESRRFCIEHEVTLINDKIDSTTPEVVVWLIPDEETEEVSNKRALSSAYAMLVSCFFLLLALAVYGVLPELRNLAGLMLMACMATYFTFFLIRIIHVFGNESETLSQNGCVTLTLIFYYLLLATFCWMNVMSFDIWWKFRSIQKSCEIHRRGVLCKFLWYCAYAWGVPLLPTLFVVTVDNLDLTHWENFVTPHLFHEGFCYFEGETHWLYVVLPIFLLICVNLLFFAMTSFNIWQVKRRLNQYNLKDSSNNRKDKNRFLVYLKLSLVMGVFWIMEVISSFVDENSPWWTITDLYNALTGVFVFLIFVCKREIFLRLSSRFSIDNRVVRYVRARTEDSRAPDVQTKSNSQTTDTSDVEPNWTPSYKTINSKSEGI